jgi:hypothetical protein
VLPGGKIPIASSEYVGPLAHPHRHQIFLNRIALVRIVEELSFSIHPLAANGGLLQGTSLKTALLATDFDVATFTLAVYLPNQSFCRDG